MSPLLMFLAALVAAAIVFGFMTRRKPETAPSDPGQDDSLRLWISGLLLPVILIGSLIGILAWGIQSIAADWSTYILWILFGLTLLLLAVIFGPMAWKAFWNKDETSASEEHEEETETPVKSSFTEHFTGLGDYLLAAGLAIVLFWYDFPGVCTMTWVHSNPKGAVVLALATLAILNAGRHHRNILWGTVVVLGLIALWTAAYRHDAAAYNTGTSFQPTWEETLLPGNGEEIEVTIPTGYRHSSAECNPGTMMHIVGPNVPERPIQQEDGTVVDFTKPFDCSRKNHLYEAWFYDARVTFSSEKPDTVKNWYLPASK